MLNLNHKAKRDLLTKMSSIRNIDGGPVVQRNCFYVAVQRWTMNGSSRLLHCAHVLTWDDMINIQVQFGVHANLCFIDYGYFTYEVYSHAADKINFDKKQGMSLPERNTSGTIDT